MTTQTPTSLPLPKSYPALLENIKTRIRESQVKAAMSVNQELIQLHWWIGSEIVKRQETEGWKAQVIDRLCKDIEELLSEGRSSSTEQIFRNIPSPNSALKGPRLQPHSPHLHYMMRLDMKKLIDLSSYPRS